MPLPVIALPAAVGYFGSGFLLGATAHKYFPVVVQKVQERKERREKIKALTEDYEKNHKPLKKVPY